MDIVHHQHCALLPSDPPDSTHGREQLTLESVALQIRPIKPLHSQKHLSSLNGLRPLLFRELSERQLDLVVSLLWSVGFIQPAEPMCQMVEHAVRAIHVVRDAPALSPEAPLRLPLSPDLRHQAALAEPRLTDQRNDVATTLGSPF